MQSHLLAGPISVTPCASALPSVAADSNPFFSAGSATPPIWTRRHRRRHRWSPFIAASSSSSSAAAVNGGGRDLYAVLGVAQTATAAEIKRAYRLLARKVVVNNGFCWDFCSSFFVFCYSFFGFEKMCDLEWFFERWCSCLIDWKVFVWLIQYAVNYELLGIVWLLMVSKFWWELRISDKLIFICLSIICYALVKIKS